MIWERDSLLKKFSNNGSSIKYHYNNGGVRYKKQINDSTIIYYYVKDETGNVISIIFNSQEVAHYVYDAWGNSTVHDITVPL